MRTKRDQLRAGSGSEKERTGEPIIIVLKTSFPPLEKRNRFLSQNFKCQSHRMFSIELLARVSRDHADLHGVLCFSAIVYICCVSENLFECGSLYVGVQKINYPQMIRPIWRIENMILQEQSQIKTTAKTSRKRLTDLRANSHI